MGTQTGSAYDYTGCSFEVRLTQKKFLSSVLRYVYFAKDRLIVCKEPYQAKPEKVIGISNRMSIRWIYDPKKLDKPFKEKTLGFCLISDKDEAITTFYGDKIIMISLYDFLGKHIFQSDFQQEYDIVQKIGKGKYAKVYKVRRKDSGEFFAVKYLHKGKMKDTEDSEASLDNELNILRTINHPNCLKLVACYQDQIGYYILTELLDETKTLQQEIVKFRNPQYSYQMAKHILRELLKGLEYIHSKGIMHRDLKPQNVMFAQSQSGTFSSLKLIDFGLGQFIHAKKYIYVHVGTPGYVAPEILANDSEDHRYDEKCDMFSIGVIFHTLLTGKTVFSGTKFSEVLQNNKQCQIKLTGPRYGLLNSDALDLLSKLLLKDPVCRISATEALKHNYFSEKNADVDKLPFASEQGTQIQKTKLINGIKDLPKIPGHKNSFSSNRECESNNYSASPTTMRNTLLQQVNQLKPMLDVLSNSPKSLVEGIYKFTRDIIGLLEDFQANKEYLFEDDYSPLKLNHRISDQLSPTGTPSNDQELPPRPQLFAFSSNYRSKENSFIHPIKIQVDGMDDSEGDNENVDENDEHVPTKEPSKHPQRKNLFVNTHLTREGQKIGENDKIQSDGRSPPEQINKQPETSPMQVQSKYHLPTNNMILNEISSPVSPPTKATIQHWKAQNSILEKEQAEPKHSNSIQGVMNPLNLNDGKNRTTSLNSNAKPKYSKEIVQFLEIFPKDMFSCYLNQDKVEILRGMKSRVFKLGLFLIFGKEALKELPSDKRILDSIKEIADRKIFHQWFVDMIKSMVSLKESGRPSFNNIHKIIIDFFKPS